MWLHYHKIDFSHSLLHIVLHQIAEVDYNSFLFGFGFLVHMSQSMDPKNSKCPSHH